MVWGSCKWTGEEVEVEVEDQDARNQDRVSLGDLIDQKEVKLEDRP
jgi:hypothetical protein